MPKHQRLSILTFLLALAVTVPLAASGADRDPSEAFEAMAAAGSAYVNDPTQCPGLINAASLHDNLDDYTVIDLRTTMAYEAGHIPGAYHSSLSTLLDDLATVIPNDKPYVLACYSGQSAGHAKIAMELMGYDQVYSLLFGMAAWHTSLSGPWNSHCADNLDMVEVEDQNGNLVEQEFPVLEGDPETIVAERVAQMLASGFRGTYFANIEDNLENYFIINYFGQDDYLGQGTSGVPGHIPGAFQFTPYQSLGIDEMLGYIPADQPVVVYGWTGQHTSQVVAYLTMLGYDAYSLNYGVNNLFYSDLTAHKWIPEMVVDFPLETGGGPLPVPDIGRSPVAALGNFPNPFNPATTIAYELTRSARVSLRIYDLSGRLVRELAGGEEQAAGPHEVVWRGRNASGRMVASGTYVYRLEAGGQAESRRLTLLK